MNVPLKFVDTVFGAESVYDEEGHAFRRDLPPGVAKWLSDTEGKPNSALTYTCPCGCGAVGAISVNTGEKEARAWQWDGNVDKPTLSPSIQKTWGCRWHGHLVNGEWVPC